MFYSLPTGSSGGYLEVNIKLVMFIELMTVCIIYDSYIFLYYFCNNIILLLHMFLHAFENDLSELPASLVEKIYVIPGLLKEWKSSNTFHNYYYVFLRWQTLGFIQWNT